MVSVLEATFGAPSLSSTRHMLLPVLPEVQRAAADKGVTDVGITIDFVCDRLMLDVRYELFTRRDLDEDQYKRLFWPRVQRMLGLESPKIAQTLRVERRQLLNRGAAARAAKPRRR